MAVRIRLQRMGRKKRPFYRVVVADSRTNRDGRYIEKLGYYNPLTDPAEIVINEERALEWLHRGAQPSDTAKSLLRKTGVWQKFHEQRLAAKSRRSEVSQAPQETNPEAPATETAQEPTDVEAAS